MADMDAVNSFNAELQSLYEVKPPISKGKMTAVTRAALKGVKLYKHVVQSVEKFIQKCKTEYKIPGLYVIDSIIRQSRHQFGAEKDVFAPRFARNIQNTFMHLYKCPEEEKAKIIRVLNLWQKNRIFSPEVIQPLFDLADPNNPIWEQLQSQEQQANLSAAAAASNRPPNSGGGGPGSAISNLLSNLPSSVPFRKEVLDYDYGDDDDGGDYNKSQSSGEHSQQNNVGLDALGSILANPEILRQLATLQEQIAAATSHGGGYPTPPEQERQRKLAELNKQEAAFDQRLAQTVARLPFAVDCELSEDGRSRKDIDQNSNQLGNNLQSNQLLPPPFFQQISEQQQQQHQGHDSNAQQQLQQQQQQAQQLLNLLGHGQRQQQEGGHNNPFGLQLPFSGGPPHFPQQDLSQAMSMFNNQLSGDGNQSFNAFNQNQGVEEIDLTDEPNKDKDRRDRGGRRKRSRERRSRSRSRRSRSRSRGRDGGVGGSRDRKRYRSRSRDRKEDKEREREKEKERVRKGLPPIKKEHLSVCSTTLWVGHLSKLVSQEDLSDTFGAYGDIISIDLIPPRGCAFIVMNRRQDSLRALDRLKNTKLQGKSITVAWAPGKGMKGREWKDYWEIDSGVSYIPWIKLRGDLNIEEFEDGGCVDEDTVPDYLKQNSKDKTGQSNMESAENSQDISAPALMSLGGGSLPEGMLNNKPQGDSTNENTRNDLAVATAMQNVQLPPPGHMPPGMPNPAAFGMPPVGMMPMGMHGMPVGMVPPPMMGPGGMPNFAAMGGIPGMPNFAGMMPPMGMGGVPAGMGGPGLLGDMPAAALANLSQINNIPRQGQVMMDHQNSMKDDDDSKKTERKEGKRRSRFNDPDEIVQPMDESNSRASPPSQEGVKDERPVFERLKSLADGYGFGNDKAGPSLLGNPGAMLGGPRGQMPGPRGFLPHGANQFGPRPPGFMGNETPLSSAGPRSWFDAPNPFLNPNPNPFAGNPFVQSNLSENPFDIGSAPPPSDSMVGGPQPLFGVGVNAGGGQDRNLFETSWGSGDVGGGRGDQGQGFMRGGGRGRGGGRDRDKNDMGGWWNNRQNESWGGDSANDEPVGGPGGWGRGRKPWGDRDAGGDEIAGAPAFGGRGGGRNSMGSDEGGRDRDRERGSRDRDRGRRDDRGDRGRSRDRDGNRRERNRSRDNNRDRDSRRRTHSRDRDEDENRNRQRTHSHSQSQDRVIPMEEEENWETEDTNVAVVETKDSTATSIEDGGVVLDQGQSEESAPHQPNPIEESKAWEQSEDHTPSAPPADTAGYSDPDRDQNNMEQETSDHHEKIAQPAPIPDESRYNNESEMRTGGDWNETEESSSRPSQPDAEFSEQEHDREQDHFHKNQQNDDSNYSEPQQPSALQERDNRFSPPQDITETYQEKEPEEDISAPCDNRNFSNFNSSQYEQEDEHEQEERSRSPKYHQQAYHSSQPEDENSSSFSAQNVNEESQGSPVEPRPNNNPIQEQVDHSRSPPPFNDYQPPPYQNSSNGPPALYGNDDDSQSQERFGITSSPGENHTEEEEYRTNNGGCEDFNAAPVDEEDSREDVMFTNNSSSNYDQDGGDSLESDGVRNLQSNPCGDYEANIPSKHHNDGYPPMNNHSSPSPDTNSQELLQEDQSQEVSPCTNKFVSENHHHEQNDGGVEVVEGGENGSS